MANITTVANTMKSYSKLYIVCLISFAFLSVLSLVFLVMGIFYDSRKLVFLSGIWFSGWGLILGFTALPIGFAAELITGGAKGSLNRYIRWVLSTFLLTGASISLLSLYIPAGKINPHTFIPLILIEIIWILLGRSKLFRVFAHLLIFVIFILHILSIFIPVNLENLIREKISDACFFVVAPKRVCITYKSLKQGEIELFRKDGKPKVWYYRKEDGAFDFFDGEGCHPVYEVELKPLTREIVPLVEQQLKKEAMEEQAKIEQERIRQEQARQEALKQEQERIKQEQLKQEQLRQEQLRQEHLKKEQKEQLDREEASRKDLIKPGVYMIEKKLWRFGSGLKAILHRIDILDDRTIRVTFLIENDTGSDVWIKMREPDGCVVLLDNLGNRYSPKTPIEAYYTCKLPYNSTWFTLDFEPLKRNVKYLNFQGLMIAVWNGSYEHGKIKFEYTLKPTDH